MHGDINIRAQVSIITKAKLDDISIKGDCLCGPAPKPPPPQAEYDVFVLLDASDSFNNKVTMGGRVEADDAFRASQQLINSHLIRGLEEKLGSRASYSFIQFSGHKQLEGSYKPGSGGKAVDELDHYRWEITNSTLRDAVQHSHLVEEGNQLDGNGQLFLLLQDLNIGVKQDGRKKILIIISDEEWDIRNLRNVLGGRDGDRDSIVAVNRKNYTTFPVIVRPNEIKDLDDHFISHKLASNPSYYQKVYTKNFDKDMKKAFKRIIETLS